MNDRELLEAAARAAGISGFWVDAGLNIRTNSTPLIWNPLEDDGDALRLAVKLGLEITPEPEFCCVTAGIPHEGFQEEHIEDGGDLYAATRRAIVRATAAIGEEMK